MRIEKNYSLLQHNTFGMDIHAKCFIEYTSVEELTSLLPIQGKVLHIGGGSNLLFQSDFEGTILHSAISGIEVVDEDTGTIMLRVGAAVVWDEFVDYAVEHGYGGIENLSLIPGEVGASAVQNIGAYGVEAKDTIALVEAVELSTGIRRVFSNLECDYSYRHSIFKDALKGLYAVTHVTYRLSKHPQLQLAYGNIQQQIADNPSPTLSDVRQAIIDIRNAKLPDPKVLGNAGSFFMNPVVSQEKYEEIFALYPSMPSYKAPNGVKIPAGWLIEQCGWKGKALGRAAVHDRQALVLVNLGGATSDEIVNLCNAICHDVNAKFGISIHPEVNFI